VTDPGPPKQKRDIELARIADALECIANTLEGKLEVICYHPK